VLSGGVMNDTEIVKGELDKVIVGGLYAVSKKTRLASPA
jgi:hypothetical protein